MSDNLKIYNNLLQIQNQTHQILAPIIKIINSKDENSVETLEQFKEELKIDRTKIDRKSKQFSEEYESW